MGLYQLEAQGRLDLFPSVEACYAWTWNDFHMSCHSHRRAEIMYLLRGTCRVLISEKGIEREIQLNVGEFIYINSGVVHALHVDKSCYMVNVEFALAECTVLISLGSMMEASPVFNAWMHTSAGYQVGKDPDGVLYGALSSIIDDFAHKDMADAAMTNLKMGQMLILMANALTSAGTRAKCLIHVRRCDKLLSERMDDKIRIADLAKEIGVSAAYLQRVFRQVHGITIIDYLNKIRIDRAKLLLANTKDTIIDIAVAAGFNSRQHFSRVFTALEGCSPQRYRQMSESNESKQIFLFP